MATISIYNKRNSMKRVTSDLVIDFVSDYYTSDYTSDAIYDFADNKVDIYTSDLYDWLRNEDEACYYMEQVVSDGLIDTTGYDFESHIRCAQCEFYRQELENEDIEDMMMLALLYKLVDRDDEVDDEIDEDELNLMLSQACNCYEFYELDDIIDEYIEEHEED